MRSARSARWLVEHVLEHVLHMLHMLLLNRHLTSLSDTLLCHLE